MVPSVDNNARPVTSHLFTRIATPVRWNRTCRVTKVTIGQTGPAAGRY
jgi:hypothetical protein